MWYYNGFDLWLQIVQIPDTASLSLVGFSHRQNHGFGCNSVSDIQLAHKTRRYYPRLEAHERI